MRNGNRVNTTIDQPAISQLNTFSEGTAVYINEQALWTRARSNNLSTLGTHIISSASGNSFTLATNGDVIRGVVSGNPGDPVQVSDVSAGNLTAINADNPLKDTTAVAHNIMGYMINETDFIVKYETSYFNKF